MREELLHFIWANRYFNHRELSTGSGDSLFIYDPGDRNMNQGPDFLRARVAIGDKLLSGAVELHVLASDWRRHRHAGDPHYADVILHVVWENDCIRPPDDIPLLILSDRTPKTLLTRYAEWMAQRRFVPCESLVLRAQGIGGIGGVSAGWFRQLLLWRLARRTEFVRSCLDANRDHWELTTWWLMARSLGMPVNTDAFFAVARSLPLIRLRGHREYPAILESLLLGQAGLLDHATAELRGLYRFYSLKYRLQRPRSLISFHRMRPAHFPTKRLIQLAGLLNAQGSWFSLLREADGRSTLLAALDAATPQGGLGTVIKKSVLLNAFIPVLYAYGALLQEADDRKKALTWLYETPPEHNAILMGWRRLGIAAESAAESQALLEMTKHFCAPKKCLECAIGRHLLTAPESVPAPS